MRYYGALAVPIEARLKDEMARDPREDLEGKSLLGVQGRVPDLPGRGSAVRTIGEEFELRRGAAAVGKGQGEEEGI